MVDLKKIFREKRNVRNYFRCLLVFTIQVILLYCMLWAINLGPILDPTEEVDIEGNSESYPYLLLITKFTCSMVLHITMQPKI